MQRPFDSAPTNKNSKPERNMSPPSWAASAGRGTVRLCMLLVLTQTVCISSPTSVDQRTADGGRFAGSLVEGLRQGIGRLDWPNGSRYEGEFDHGLYAGHGRLHLGSGDTYDGMFADGMMSGHGRMVLANGSTYVGEFRNNWFSGHGRFESADGDVYEGEFDRGVPSGHGRQVGNGDKYEGEFRQGRYSGHGELTKDGNRYTGEFLRGRFEGRGRYETASGEVYEGDFRAGEFTGHGTLTNRDGSSHSGEFQEWRPHGKGTLRDSEGTVYVGRFDDSGLSGRGTSTTSTGDHYAGEFKYTTFEGQGILKLANGDVYTGGFSHGLYEGKGTLEHAKPLPDGRTEETGVWHYGHLADPENERRAKANVELALYKQGAILDRALAQLAPSDPTRINMYFLGVAGDGRQEVFRREVDFVRDQFDRNFGTRSRSIVLINSRNTVEYQPMATRTSIRAALHAIAARMDVNRDILFLYLTSHGSKDHELTLAQSNMGLPNLPAKELGTMLEDSGIRWKVVVVSACYAGGFIDAIHDDRTLVVAAARRDRTSFGCSDANEFTYFGRAFFKEALAHSRSFEEAFDVASGLVEKWESDLPRATGGSDEVLHSSPQMVSPRPIQEYLRGWWSQLGRRLADSHASLRVE